MMCGMSLIANGGLKLKRTTISADFITLAFEVPVGIMIRNPVTRHELAVHREKWTEFSVLCRASSLTT